MDPALWNAYIAATNKTGESGGLGGPVTTSSKAPRRRRGGAAEDVRRRNLAALMERIHLDGPASRSELTARTELNRSTIAHLIGELADLGLVVEAPGPTASGPGRPSPVVHPRAEGGVVLAIESDVDSIAVATIGLGGHVYNRLRITRPQGRFSPEETVQDVAALAGPLVSSLPQDHRFVGVGMAVAGITRRSDGFVHFAPNLGWRDVPIGKMLASELGIDVPVRVANEADLGALAESRRGPYADVANLIYVSGEVGIGIGAIVNRQPLLGSAGYAGEAGHMLINPDGVSCHCGAIGCWETEAGELALLRHAGIADGGDAIDEVVDRAAAGDRRVVKALAEVGRWLGLGIGNITNLFNPDVVVLGGVYHRLFGFLEDAVMDGLRRQTLSAPGDMVTVAASGLGPDAPLLGAAELVLADVIADPAAISVPARSAG